MKNSSVDLFDFQDAPYALQTYYCYVRAWAEKIRHLYGQQPKCFDGLKDALISQKSVQRIQEDKTIDRDIVAAYTRGRLTLKAMEAFPIKENKELAPTANLWLPVQAYYATHGIGIATVLSLGYTAPKTHESFKAAFPAFILKYLPDPFSAQCKGGPSSGDFNFVNLSVTPKQVKQQSNLSNPQYADINCILGKCLSTTRERLLEESFKKARRDSVRRGKRRRNLSTKEKLHKAEKLHPITIIDFLYRMRIRSNYEEPDIHLYASEQKTDEAVRHYFDLLFLTQAIVFSLSLIMRQKIGNKAMNDLEKRLT